jgi:2OG-Fe(II) oxygenase superfamily
MNQIYEFENFLSSEECDQIITWFSTTPKMITNGQYLFNGKTIDYQNIQNTQIKKLINSFKIDATSTAKRIFDEEYLYVDYTSAVLWESGSGMVIHADNSDLEGNPNYCPWRCYSGVLNLNDDFAGGETFFPDHGPHFIKPKKGKLSLYPSDLSFKHGVSTVIGTRYTLPIWFTRDKNYTEV